MKECRPEDMEIEMKNSEKWMDGRWIGPQEKNCQYEIENMEYEYGRAIGVRMDMDDQIPDDSFDNRRVHSVEPGNQVLTYSSGCFTSTPKDC